MSNKWRYVSYTEDEVKRMETGYFILQFGGDAVLEDGHYLFTKTEVEKIYKRTLKDLMGIVSGGDEKDRRYALDLILGLVVLPMRLH